MKRGFFLLVAIALSMFLLNLSNATAQEVTEKSEFDELISTYYNNGVYKKSTSIKLNEEGVNELKIHFHVSTVLDRITYYVHDSLWMSQTMSDDAMYSYYGTHYTDGVADGVTYGTTKNYLTPPTNTSVVLSGEGKESMEAYYITLKDIMDYGDSVWEYNDGVYTSYDQTTFKQFLNFTAPCLYDSIIDSFIFDYAKATISVNFEGDLELALWISSTDYGYIIGGEDSVVDGATILSKAIIKNPSIKGKEVDTYPNVTNADIVTFNGDIYTYGGNIGKVNADRITSIYRYDVDENKLYELDVNIAIKSTSHRVVLHGGKVYIFGGLTDGSQRITYIQVHDLVNQTIEVLDKELPFGMNCEQVGYYNNKVYFAGGSYAKPIGSTDKIYEMDLDTLELVELDVKLPAVVFKGAWCSIDNYLYIIGGTNGPRLTSIYRFDMATKTIETMNAVLPTQTSQQRAAYDGNGNIYVYGGTIEGNILVDTIYRYNIYTDTIETLPYTLPYIVANITVCRVNDSFYILGGDNAYNNIVLKHQGDTVVKVFGLEGKEPA